MKPNECFLKSGNDDWYQILGCNVHMRVARRMQRTIIRGQEGDDLLDEGSESAIYTVTGSMGMPEYQEVLKIFRSGQPWFHDPFEDRQMKVIFSTVDYDSATGDYEFVLVEDIDPDDD